MKKKQWILILVIIAVLGGLSIPVVNLAVGAPTGTRISQLAQSHPEMAGVIGLLETNCANCHTTDTALPFYASLPIASTIVTKDIELGRRFFDLAGGLMPEKGTATTEPTLAKIQWQVSSGQMPPFRYTALHWEAGLSEGDHTALTQWIEQTRVSQFAPKGLPKALAVHAVHPIPESIAADPKMAKLGRQLYFDKRLSGDNTVSCATCHDLNKGGTDQLPVSLGIKDQKGGINSPTTLNSAFNVVQFWDGRAGTLQDQAAGPPLNPVEMGATWEGIIKALTADEAFASAFTAVYPKGITAETITHAIAEYERTLLTPNAPFDNYLRGDKTALNDEATQGWHLFQEYGCHTCHVGKALGGQSFELMGRAQDYFAQRQTPKSEADDGRFNFSKKEMDRYRFKVPILRNIENTFPYFHDGTVAKLDRAVELMAQVQLDKSLSPSQTKSIVAFLKSLTGVLTGDPNPPVLDPTPSPAVQPAEKPAV